MNTNRSTLAKILDDDGYSICQSKLKNRLVQLGLTGSTPLSSIVSRKADNSYLLTIERTCCFGKSYIFS